MSKVARAPAITSCFYYWLTCILNLWKITQEVQWFIERCKDAFVRVALVWYGPMLNCKTISRSTKLSILFHTMFLIALRICSKWQYKCSINSYGTALMILEMGVWVVDMFAHVHAAMQSFSSSDWRGRARYGWDLSSAFSLRAGTL